MIYFLDASALVKRYVREPGSDTIRSLFVRRRRMAVSALSAIEISAALWRRAREHDLDGDIAAGLVARATSDMTEMLVVEPRGAVLDLAAALVAKHPLRAYDAMQLASALRLSRSARLPMTFGCGANGPVIS